MTGGEFRNLSAEDKKKLLPCLRVLARSKPADKEELVIWYKTQNSPKDIVAVTDDGANIKRDIVDKKMTAMAMPSGLLRHCCVRVRSNDNESVKFVTVCCVLNL